MVNTLKPDATLHNPDPEHIRGLIKDTGLSQREVARRLGVTDRLIRYYVAGERECPYTVQYCLERLRGEL